MKVFENTLSPKINELEPIKVEYTASIVRASKDDAARSVSARPLSSKNYDTAKNVASFNPITQVQYPQCEAQDLQKKAHGLYSTQWI